MAEVLDEISEGYRMKGEPEIHAGASPEDVQRGLETPQEPLSALEREEIRLQLAARHHMHQENDQTRRVPVTIIDNARPQRLATTDRLRLRVGYTLVPASVNTVAEPRSTPVWRIELHVYGNGSEPIGLDVARDSVVGRHIGQESPVDVNLEPYGGYEQGVSRRHAMLRPGADSLFLVDLKSTNGTLHNNRRLGPGIACPLKNGDVLSFGGLSCTVKIIGQLSLGER